MGFNRGKIKVESTAKKKTKKDAWKNDVPWSLAGQWKYPGQVTKVPSGDITMEGVNYPVFGVDNLGNEQMMTPGGNYQFPGNVVTEYPMAAYGGNLPKAQIGHAGKTAYAKYQENIAKTAPNLIGTKFRANTENMPDAEGLDPADFNCIGGACNFVQGAGADVPIIPGNSSFWEQAQASKIPVKVYADSATEDYAESWDFVKSGDYIGHDLGPGAGKNLYYPEHTNVFLRWDTNPNTGEKVAIMMDANTGEDHSYEERSYSYDDLVNPKNKSFFFGRPTRVGGQDLEFDYPKGVDPNYFPKVSEETLSGLKPFNFNLDKEKLKTLSQEQINKVGDIGKTLIKYKKPFIKATGMSEEDYDELGNTMPGLAYQETKLGKTNPTAWQGLKNFTQGDFKDAYTTQKEELKQLVGGLMGKRTSKGDFQVKEDDIFGYSPTRTAMKRLGITKDNYDPNNTEHNILAAMVLFNDKNKGMMDYFDPASDNFREGNEPNLSKSEKLLYLYNQPYAARQGEAKGDSIYVKNIKNKFNKPVDRPRPVNKGMYRQFGGQNNNAMNLPEGYHMMPDGTVMLDNEMDYRRGGNTPCYECGGGVHYNDGGDTGLKGGPNERPSAWDMFQQGFTDMLPDGNTMRNFSQGFMSMLPNENTLGNIALGVASPFLDEAQLKAYYESINKPEMKKGGNWMADIKSTGQCTGANFGGPNCRPGTREYAFAKRARAGEFSKKFGGSSSTAPQNTTIDSIGNKRIQLLENKLTQNTMDYFSKQYQEQLKQQMANYFEPGGRVRSEYNPEMSYANLYAAEQEEAENNLARDFNAFGDALNVSAGKANRRSAMKARQQDVQSAQTQFAQDMEGADASMYSFSNPNQMVPSNFNPAQSSPAYGRYDVNAPAGTYAYGGGLPEYQIAGTTKEGLTFFEAAMKDKAAKEAQAKAYAKWQNQPPAAPSYGQGLVQQVGRPNLLMTDLYPNASSAEGLTSGVNWGQVQAEQDRLAQSLVPNYLSTRDNVANPAMFNPVTAQVPVNSSAVQFSPTSNLINPFAGTWMEDQWLGRTGPGTPGWYEQHVNKPEEVIEEEEKVIEEEKVTGDKDKKGSKEEEKTVVTDETKKPNYKETKEGESEESSTTMGGREEYYPTYGSGFPGGVRKRKIKMTYTDPITGKKRRFKDKMLYDAAGYPTGSGMTPYGGPRNIRIKNKDFTIINGQMVPGRDVVNPNVNSDTQLKPGEGVLANNSNPEVTTPPVEMIPQNVVGPGTWSRGVSDNNQIPTADESDAIYAAREAQLARLAQDAQDKKDYQFFSGARQNEARRRDQGYDAMQDLRNTSGPMAGYAYGGSMNYMQPGGVPVVNGVDPFTRIPQQPVEAFYTNAPSPEAIFVDPMINEYTNAPGVGDTGPSRRSIRIDEKFNEALARDEAMAGYEQGGSYFPQPYPGGMQPNGQGAYFFGGGGQPQYENGGTYDLTQAEIDQIESMGGTVQYI